MEKVCFKFGTKLSFEKSGKEEVQFSERSGVVLEEVFMEDGRLFQSVEAVFWKEQFESLRVDVCGQSRERVE